MVHYNDTAMFFGYYWTELAQWQGFPFFPTLLLQGIGWGWAKDLDSWPKLFKGLFHTTTPCSAIKPGAEEKGDDRWAIFFFFFCKPILPLLNCHYLDPQAFSLLFLISPPSCGEAGGRGEWSSVCVGLWLLAKASLRQTFASEKWGFTIQIESKRSQIPHSHGRVSRDCIILRSMKAHKVLWAVWNHWSVLHDLFQQATFSVKGVCWDFFSHDSSPKFIKGSGKLPITVLLP